MSNTPTFIHALRPFSLIVAAAACGLGISLALLEGSSRHDLALLVMLCGLLLQMSVNLVNDSGDIHRPQLSSVQRQLIRRNTRWGQVLLAVAMACGLYLVSVRGWLLLLLGMVGVFGAWGYTGGPVNYKQRGLGVILVFWLMGILMIGGSYYIVSGDYHWGIFWLSLPFSLLSSLLLLSNELRDHEQDEAENIRTLSVRIGYPLGIRLYYLLVTLIYLSTVFLFSYGLLPSLLYIFLSLLALWQPLKLLYAPGHLRKSLTPLTGRFYLIFSLTFLFTLWQPTL